MTVSAIGIISLLVHKHIELSRGITTKVQEMRAKTDPVLRSIQHTTGKFLTYFTLHNGVLLINWLFVHVVRSMMYISRKVHDISATLAEKASQKTEDLSRGGSASFYLKQIKDAKDQTEKYESEKILEEVDGEKKE